MYEFVETCDKSRYSAIDKGLELFIRDDTSLYRWHCPDLSLYHRSLVVEISRYMSLTVSHREVRARLDEQLHHFYMGLQSFLDDARAVVAALFHVLAVLVQEHLYLILAVIGEHECRVTVHIL